MRAILFKFQVHFSLNLDTEKRPSLSDASASTRRHRKSGYTFLVALFFRVKKIFFFDLFWPFQKKPCGVDYELKAYCADDLEEKPHKRNSVRLAIRKLTYAPPSRAPQPMVDAHREFMMSPAPLHLECTLDKEMYYHGESINVNVQATNNSNKTVKKIRISGWCWIETFFSFLFGKHRPNANSSK